MGIIVCTAVCIFMGRIEAVDEGKKGMENEGGKIGKGKRMEEEEKGKKI